MKKTANTLALIALIITLTGCVTIAPIGIVMTDVDIPVAVTDEGTSSPKTGEASCVSYVMVYAKGDCSIETAKKNGGIEEVTSVDWHYDSILGIVNNYKVIVHGK